MKTVAKNLKLFLALTLFTTSSAFGQNDSKNTIPSTQNVIQMKTYVIEREIPDLGKLTAEQLKSVSQKSCAVLQEVGDGIQWLHSYVTGNKLYCIYKAENEDLIREHARKGGFPANKISEVSTIISPATATN